MNFFWVYDGPALENHEIDARQLGISILAINDIFSRMNEVVNGDRAIARTTVHASFQTGCFKIDMQIAIGAIELIKNLLINDPTTAILNGVAIFAIFREVIGFVIKQKGRQVEIIARTSDGKCIVKSDSGQFEIEERIINLYRNAKLRKALDDAIAKPLEKDGIDSVGVLIKDSVKFMINKSESTFFHFNDDSNMEVVVQEVDTTISPLGIAFDANRKWRVYHPTIGKITVFIEDDVFLKRIAIGNDSFSATDSLDVTLKIETWDEGIDNQRVRYTIIKVIKHNYAKQLELE